MTISVGDKLPDSTFMTMTAEGPSQVSTADVFAGNETVGKLLPKNRSKIPNIGSACRLR